MIPLRQQQDRWAFVEWAAPARSAIRDSIAPRLAGTGRPNGS